VRLGIEFLGLYAHRNLHHEEVGEMANPRRTRGQWQQLVAAWERSDLSAEAFAARRRDLNPRALSWWRTQFRRAGREEQQESVPDFLLVQVEGLVAPCEPVAVAGPVEVVLGNGVKLHFEHRLDAVGLTALAAAFGGRS
jgi:hypothetical protein